MSRLILAVLVLAGCGRVEADHPLDPDTPPSKQHRARLSGQLTGVSAELLQAEAEVNLFSGESDDVSALHSTGVDQLGNFLFEAVPPGLYRLNVSVPGFAADDRILRLGSLDDFHIGRVILRAVGETASEPGAVTGRVALRRLGDADRLAAATVSLSDGQSANVDAGGTVRFEDVPAGDLTVTVRAPGYDAVIRPLSLGSGATVDFGTIELPHASSGPDAAWLAGTLQLSDGAAPGGTRVEIRVDGTALVLARVVADVDGAFEALAAPDEAYTVHVARAGYDEATAGPFELDDGDGRYEDEAGDPPALTLDPE